MQEAPEVSDSPKPPEAPEVEQNDQINLKKETRKIK